MSDPRPTPPVVTAKDKEEARDLRRRLNDLPDYYQPGADGGMYHCLPFSADDLLASALAAARAEGAVVWRPMDTAPRDREVLLAVEMRAGVPGRCLVGHFMEGGHCIEDHPPIERGWYFWNGNIFDRASKPLWWMPLPEVPRS